MHRICVFLCGCLLPLAVHPQFLDNCSPIAEGDPHTQISYGETTQRGELRYQLQLRWYGDLVCGATLVKVGPHDTQAVLTAASCITGPDPFFYSFQSGDWDLDTFVGDREQNRWAEQVFYPASYNRSRPYENDIALIIPNEPFELDNMTEPISLPPAHERLSPNKTVLASGWGSWHPILGELTCKLQKVEMSQVDQETCQRVYDAHGEQIIIQETMFCIGDMDSEPDPIGAGQGPCDVDFGGPLVDVEKGYLAGITSHYIPHRCAYVGYPSISTRVAPFVPWIESKVAEVLQKHQN